METLTLQVVPSMLDADQSRLGEELAALEAAGADRIQWDVMDGSFVPRITHGADPIKAVREQSRLAFEAHLMVDRPEAQWAAFADAGCEIVIVHAEATRHLHLLLQDIRGAGLRAGVAINPGTPLTAVIEVLDLVDHLLVMTVNPGRGGQKFITSMLGKVAEARTLIDQRNLVIDLEVDGGVSAENAPVVTEAGANLLVAGSAVHRHPEGRSRAIETIRAEAMRGWRRRLKLRAEAGDATAPDGAGNGLARGIELFNQKEFWEAHEAWEGAWMPHRHEPEGDFYKGLVQVAAGFYHYNRRNRNGALIKWRDGVEYLRRFLPEREGIPLEPLIERVEACRERLEAGSGWPALDPPRLEVKPAKL